MGGCAIATLASTASKALSLTAVVSLSDRISAHD
jgi:hypothetical protein